MRSPVAIGVAISCLLVAGCGSHSSSEAEKAKLDAARRAGARQERLHQQQLAQRREQEQLKRKIAKLEKESRARRATQPAPAATSTAPAAAAPATGASCGGNLSVGPKTTCGFAVNVESAYFDSGGGSGTVRAFSPVTNQWYTMTCTAGAPTVCRGGNNAVVYIR
jgi:hypothetical protein